MNKIQFVNLIPKPTENKKEKKNRDIVRLEFIMNPVTDADIIARLNIVGNKSEYIRKLIRRDIKKGTR